MSVPLHWWMLALVMTAGAWVNVFVFPERSDGYGVGAMLQFFGAVGATLVIWLIYFACLAFWGTA